MRPIVLRRRRARIAALALPLLLLGGPALEQSGAQDTGCTSLPPLDPSKNFFSNFLNACYAIRLPSETGSGRSMMDPDQTYGGFFYGVDPNYELIIIGEFPRARTLSITLDDSHYANQDYLTDSRLKPLIPGHVNPFQAGVPHREDQLYAVVVSFGGTRPAASSIAPGCGFAGLDVGANALDATKRHPGISWNGDALVASTLPAHDDAGPNTGGLLTVRQYMRGEDLGTFRLAWPMVIVRDLRTGCAVPAAQALGQDPAALPPGTVLSRTQEVAQRWMDFAQVRAHELYRDYQPAMCHRVTPPVWMRPNEYIPLPNPDAVYLLASISPERVATLTSSGGFMRLRFRMPSMPSIPCDGCVLSGSEELRYLNLSFFDDANNTIASLGEFEIVRRPDGYATVIVGFGARRPKAVTAANYYTWVDLSTVEGFANFRLLGLRMVGRAPGFQCSAAAVAPLTSEDNSLGGMIGEYAPVIDFVSKSALTGPAPALVHPASCGLVPPEALTVCPM